MPFSLSVRTLRAWVAFVGFMDLGTAARCFLDEAFLGTKVYDVEGPGSVSPSMTRLFGIWSILNALILFYCALCIHCIPILVLTICSLTLSIIYYLGEAFLYQSTSYGASVYVPLAVWCTTVVWLISLWYYFEAPQNDDQDENELLKKRFLGRSLNKRRRC